MTLTDILRKEAGSHLGYIPQSVAVTTLDPADVSLKQLRGVPQKIAAYFRRDKIVTVHKSECFKEPENYYVLTTTDGTRFHVEY